MRINKFLAQATGLSRRAADRIISDGRVLVNNQRASLGGEVKPTDSVTLNGRGLQLPKKTITIMLNKPVGYVCSRDGQGSKTIYDLLPSQLHSLKPVGRLDKDSSGLLLLTNDGALAHQLTHPSFAKEKTYKVRLNRVLDASDRSKIESGVHLDDGLSKLSLTGERTNLVARLHEGRNRQIRRTFAALGYDVKSLHRTNFGPYEIKDLKAGEYLTLVP
ncbi:MAG TPA: pseudouridine synthase [Patescibacteria group bacterium]|nr:pseudouridine synthase [Patescibacteria group bacterium]